MYKYNKGRSGLAVNNKKKKHIRQINSLINYNLKYHMPSKFICMEACV